MPKNHTVRLEFRLARASLPGYPDGIPYCVPAGQVDLPIYVTERALFVRVSRALRCQDPPLTLHRCRLDSRWLPDLGRYYATDGRSWLKERCDDLEAWARELRVLRPGEHLQPATTGLNVLA